MNTILYYFQRIFDTLAVGHERNSAHKKFVVRIDLKHFKMFAGRAGFPRFRRPQEQQQQQKVAWHVDFQSTRRRKCSDNASL